MAVSLIDRAKATLAAKWVESVIGQQPPVIDHGDYLEVDFTPEQIQLFKNYLNNQVRGAFTATNKKPPTVQIRFGKILIPWSIENLAPFFIGSFGLGYLTKYLTGGK